MTITCAETGKSSEVESNADGSPRLPRGWKRIGDEALSPQGWTARYVPRSMRLPIASATVDGSDDREAGWKSFRFALQAAWGDATRYANLAISHYAARDFAVPLVRDENGKITLPKIEREMQNGWRREVYGLHHDFPAIDATSAGAISLEAWATWRRWRWDVRVTGKRSLPTYRFPFPLPMVALSLRWSVDPGNDWITVRLRMGGTKYLLRLSNSPKYRRASQSIRDSIEAGLCGEVSLIERDGRPWAAVSVAMPKRPRGALDPERKLAVKMGGGDLFRAVAGDSERVWTLHADDFLPVAAAWSERLQHLSDDRKFERRRSRSGERYQAMVDRHTRKHHDWLSVQLHRRSRELVDFAKRMRCGAIEIDLAPTAGLPSSRLLELIRQKADEYGMVVTSHEDASVSVVS